ncbi:hypothetical protein ACH79_09150 [Bradyrhizobium sp. CCBAU 051011]|uniref:hypothetical protein n=1 Tax=Bradyrhizobium sp. CCBAU 051011 TaxID=858422 RepID=UPI001373E4C9|nr:hypothetical protein [Bradyrhizobium sp. CCBAU 051011]QHO72766.1 hypothetical protein ACH79_09150 [Bradyrhizobium sp. CCBAU 051011]
MNTTGARSRTQVAILAIGAWIASGISATAQDAVQLERLLTKEEQTKLGISTMPPDKRDAMRGALIRMYRQGYRAAQGTDRASPVIGTGVAETQVDGDFKGWEGQTIVKLMTGQIWQQTEYHYEYIYAYMPKVQIYPSDGGYKMKVDGTSKAIGVQRLR